MGENELPFVTIAIPCLDEARHIERVARSALAQDYPAQKLEVLIADGGSTDGTRAILARLAAADSRVRVLDNPRRIQAAAMNVLIREARGEVIVRLDAHADYALDYVRRVVDVLHRTGADNVGGAQRPRPTSFFQHAVCAALSSPLGVGGAAYRSAEKEGWVDTVFLGAFRRRVFETAGMYDACAITNEDAELNQRILESGGKIFLSRDVVAHYYPRETWSSLGRQYFRYGMGRARTLIKHRGLPTPRPLLPFAMVASGALMAATSSALLLPSAAVYALVTGAEAVRVGRTLGARGIVCVWMMFPVLHVCHGVGFAAGLGRYLAAPDWTEPERLARRAA